MKKKKSVRKKRESIRLVSSRTYCLPPAIIKWLDETAIAACRSTSSLLTELLLEINKKTAHK